MPTEGMGKSGTKGGSFSELAVERARPRRWSTTALSLFFLRTWALRPDIMRVGWWSSVGDEVDDGRYVVSRLTMDERESFLDRTNASFLKTTTRSAPACATRPLKNPVVWLASPYFTWPESISAKRP